MARSCPFMRRFEAMEASNETRSKPERMSEVMAERSSAYRDGLPFQANKPTVTIPESPPPEDREFLALSDTETLLQLTTPRSWEGRASHVDMKGDQGGTHTSSGYLPTSGSTVRDGRDGERGKKGRAKQQTILRASDKRL
jgi:hypothetical protein